jgi:Holliday junction resolvase-like predicted endonuclease
LRLGAAASHGPELVLRYRGMKPRNIGVAAEAFAAGQFARCGYDISVQYGANQPEYDLIVAEDDRMLKISVKGSQDGSWGLTQNLLKNADYHGAIEKWLQRRGTQTVFCFVQFEGVALDKLPRTYLARPVEVAQRMRETAKGCGDSILYESHSWGPRAVGAGTVERIPDSWRFSAERLDQLIAE